MRIFLRLIILLACFGTVADAAERITKDVVTAEVKQQYQAVLPGGESALAVSFTLEKDWHFYASPDSAPGGMNLKINPSAQGVSFDEPVFPPSHLYYDKTLEQKLDVFSDSFTVVVPFTVDQAYQGSNIDVTIAIEGAVCSAEQCRIWNVSDLSSVIKIASDITGVGEPKFNIADYAKQAADDIGASRPAYPLIFALFLAFAAGLALNIMPCVWPVLPLIVMRIVEQSRQSRSKSAAMGVLFCLGILAFFACLAGANIILQVFYGRVLQWGDQFRSPLFLTVMSLLMVVLAMFMFGLFSINLPSSLAGKGGSGKGFTGALGMGFLAAVLSTPCSFGVLAAAFAWAQTQGMVLASLGIMFIGLGMAAPYAVLVAMPGLVKQLPKAGGWMEIFKQSLGFVLLIIAVKLLGALPVQIRTNVLYYSVILAFCVWMWGSWISYGTKSSRKIVIRLIAAALAVLSGFVFLSGGKENLIDWQDYDAAMIEQAKAENRPVLIKFTADWCLSCEVVERTVYSRRDIADLIKQKNVLAVKGDTTRREQPATIALQDVYNEPGVPVSMLFVPGKEKMAWRGLRFADQLKKELEGIESR